MFGQGNIPVTDFIGGRRVITGKVERPVIMLQKERLKVGQCVAFAKQAPDTVLVFGIAVAELYGLQLGKFLYQGFIDDELLDAILTERFVLVLAKALFQEFRHLKVRVSKQGWNAYRWSNHLGIE